MIKISKKQILDYQESLCITVAVIVAILISLCFRINNGCWIPMTVGLMFLSTEQGQGAIIQKTKDRAIGTIIGVMLAFLFISIFMYANYKWGYLLPCILFIGTYLFYSSNNYVFWTLTITMLISVCLAITANTPFSAGALLFKRTACTFTGIGIAIIAEYVIYRKAASVAPKIKDESIEYFCSQGEIIRLASLSFFSNNLDNKEFSLDLNDRVWTHITKIDYVEKMFSGLKKEFGYDQKNDAFYHYFFNHIIKISRKSRKLLSIAAHEKVNTSVIEIDKLKGVSEQLSYKYGNIMKYFQKVEDDCTVNIKLLINNIEPIDRKSSTYLYLKILHSLSVLADEICSSAQNNELLLP